MARVRKAVPTGAERRKAGFITDFADLVRTLTSLSDTYRPERHYMRGPGPKWHEKYDRAPTAAESHPVAALVRVKA
jgi:hypothetical protein